MDLISPAMLIPISIVMFIIVVGVFWIGYKITSFITKLIMWGIGLLVFGFFILYLLIRFDVLKPPPFW
jgi:hypothetical protein